MAYGILDKSFGEMVRSKRQNARLTQERLAEIAGISVVYCRDIEIGKSRPNWVICMKLCVALNIDLNVIINKYIKPELNDIGTLLGMEF